MKKLIVAILMIASTAQAGNYTLDIVNVDEVGTANRIKFAYPGIAYEVPIAAEGGDFPYAWALTANTTCTGATISSEGVVSWASPQVAETGCTIEVQVTDAGGATDTESYTVTVTSSTDRFLFVQDNYSGTKSGSISQPYEDLSEIWDTVTDTDKIIYFRTGTYHIPHIAESERNGVYRVDIGASDPVAFLGYPGETATINEEGMGATGYNFLPSRADVFFGNLTFTDIRFYGLSNAGADYLTIYDCIFGTLYTSDASSNQAYINYIAGASASEKNVISHNNFSGTVVGSNCNGIETYYSNHHITQYNVFSGLPRGLYYKDRTHYSTATKNQFLNNNSGFEILAQYTSQNNEIRFNFFKDNGSDVYTSLSGSMNPTYFIRNTFYNSTSGIQLRNPSDQDHTSTWYRNAIQNSYGDSGSVGDSAFYRNRTYYRYFSTDEYNTITYTDNLTGATGVVDSNGLLVNRSYVGTYGWELAASTPSPGLTGITTSGVTIR